MSDSNHKTVQHFRDTEITISFPRLRLSLQRMYETGRQSVNTRPFSVSEAFVGAFVAELITAAVYLFSSDSPKLVLQGVWEKPLVIHVISTLVLGVLSAGAYLAKSTAQYTQLTDTDARDFAVQDELDYIDRASSPSKNQPTGEQESA